jgi:hypothetical protein
MAFANDIILTYDDNGMIDDVMEFIIGLTPTKTPLFSGLPKEKAEGIEHYWQEQTLTVAQHNAVVEGTTFGSPTHQQPVRPQNTCQIFEKVHDVSSSDQWVKKYGITDQFLKQERENMEKIATDIENAILNGSRSTGNATVARRMGGLMNFLSANTTTVVSGTKLTESFFNDLLQNIWDDGGEPDEVYTNSFLKRVISDFTGGNTINANAENQRVVNKVTYYESDFGVQQIFIHRYMLNTSNSNSAVLILDRMKNYIAVGEPVHPLSDTEVGQTHHGKKGVIRGELTLAPKAQLHQGWAKGFYHSFN